ncbi:MAG TPA: hypothetical protein VH599_08685 [Ktedonobacterales bacterium]
MTVPPSGPLPASSGPQQASLPPSGAQPHASAYQAYQGVPAENTGRAAAAPRITRSFSGILQRLTRRFDSGQTAMPNPTPSTPFPEPPGLAPERAIVLSINRSPAESIINLPAIQDAQAGPRSAAIPESRALTPALPREAPISAQSGPVIVPQRQPDGQGAPLPRNQKQFRRRVIGSSVAVILVLVITGITVVRLLTPAQDLTLVAPTRLGAFPTGSALAASSLFIQPAWSAADSVQVAADADHIAALTPLPPDAAAGFPQGDTAPLARRVQTLTGLGQTQMGIQAPMDVSIAATDHYVVEAVDAGFQIIDTQDKVLSIGFVQFFHQVRHTADVFGEPLVIFDPTGQQWVLVVNEIAKNSLGNVASYFDVAISTTSSPLDLWHVYQIPTLTNDYGTCNWADDPQLGSNALGFFIAGSNFNCGTDGTLNGVVLWELPRAKFGKGKSEAPLRWTRFTNKGQPLLSLVPAVESGTTSTEWLVGNDAGESDSADYQHTSRSLHLWAIAPVSSPGQATGAALPRADLTLAAAYADPPLAQQPTPDSQANQSSPRLSTGDARVARAQFVNGHLYIAFTTAVNWVGDSLTRSGIYWIDLAPSLVSRTRSISARVVQAGILGLPGTYLFTPTLAADAQGDMILSAQIASSSIYPGIIYTSRRSSDPPGEMGQENTIITLQSGTKPFGAHWGDYAGSSLVFDSTPASSRAWIAAPVIDPGSESDEIASSWRTRMWEFEIGDNPL